MTNRTYTQEELNEIRKAYEQTITRLHEGMNHIPLIRRNESLIKQVNDLDRQLQTAQTTIWVLRSQCTCKVGQKLERVGK